MIRFRGNGLRAPTLHIRGEYRAPREALGLVYIRVCTGMWRSLVARTAGGREVAGSSPVIPTTHEITAFYEPVPGFI